MTDTTFVTIVDEDLKLYNIVLSDEQIRLLEWLESKELLQNYCNYKIGEVEEI